MRAKSNSYNLLSALYPLLILHYLYAIEGYKYYSLQTPVA